MTNNMKWVVIALVALAIAFVLWNNRTASEIVAGTGGVVVKFKPETEQVKAVPAPPIYNGRMCSVGSECQSGYCGDYPDGRNYCFSKEMNCAEPNTAGLRFGEIRVVDGTRYTCLSGVGWKRL
jgi:hypothetical protein